MLSLLSPDDYEDLPDEPMAKWIHLERVSRARLKHLVETSEEPSLVKRAKLQYMKTISAAAKASGIDGIAVPAGADPTNGLDNFLTDVEAEVATILLTNAIAHHSFGVKISDGPKKKIRLLVAEVQETIPDLKLATRRSKKLNDALIAFLEELDAPRARFAVGSSQLVVALTILNLAVTTIGSGDEALENIMEIQSIWGEEHERHESEKLGISYQGPVALIEAPKPPANQPDIDEANDP